MPGGIDDQGAEVMVDRPGAVGSVFNTRGLREFGDLVGGTGQETPVFRIVKVTLPVIFQAFGRVDFRFPLIRRWWKLDRGL